MANKTYSIFGAGAAGLYTAWRLLDGKANAKGKSKQLGKGEPPGAAVRDALQLSQDVVTGTVSGLAHLATGKDTKQISGPVGIVRASAAGWRDAADVTVRIPITGAASSLNAAAAATVVLYEAVRQRSRG